MVPVNSYGGDVIRSSVAMMILTGLAVFLRFYSRTRTRTCYAADDWWILASLLIFYTFMGLSLWSQ